MIRSTSFVDLAPEASADDLDRLAAAVAEAGRQTGAVAAVAGRTDARVNRGADLMILAAYAGDAELEAAEAHPFVAAEVRPLLDRLAAHVETVRYHQAPVRLRQPGLTGGIQRTLALRVDPDTPAETVAEFERVLADMHHYIAAIVNSSLSRVVEVRTARGPAWTHIWEQEYETVEGLTVDYMRHAYHWAYVDTWFDVQAPNQIVDRTLVHVACPLPSSILGLA